MTNLIALVALISGIWVWTYIPWGRVGKKITEKTHKFLDRM